mmetsp:Transcript_7257/g.8317  ORF Transcript_7257/g.8317 Transcript_7257/m.8317 type:complete len:175 (-) Transcript_7257:734-1258(-)
MDSLFYVSYVGFAHLLLFGASCVCLMLSGRNVYTLSLVKSSKLNQVSGAQDLNEYERFERLSIIALILLPVTTGEFFLFCLTLPLSLLYGKRTLAGKLDVDPAKIFEYEYLANLETFLKVKAGLACVVFLSNAYYFSQNSVFPLVHYMIVEWFLRGLFGNHLSQSSQALSYGTD